MKLDEILHGAGRYKKVKRIGRGTGSGHGKTSTRGSKGAGARAGWKQRIGTEGGQNPTLARIPKRGFNNFNFRKEYQVVNVADLERFDDGARVDSSALAAAGLIRQGGLPVKILGGGELTRKLTVAAAKVSKSAGEKIAKAGGTVEQA